MEQFDFEEYIYENSISDARNLLYSVAYEMESGREPQDICLTKENAKIMCEIYKLAEKLK